MAVFNSVTMSLSSVTENSATFSWSSTTTTTAGSSAGAIDVWLYFYGFDNNGSLQAYALMGTVPGRTGTGTVSRSGTYTATGLRPSTSYQFVGRSFGSSSGTNYSNYSVSATTSAPAVPPPVFYSESWPNGRQGEDYFGYIIFTGDPTSYSVVGGSIPSGMYTYNSGNVWYIAGTPTVSGNVSLTLRASNAGGYIDRSISFFLYTAFDPSWGGSFFPDGKVGVAYSASVTATRALSVSGSGAPTGLSFSSSGATLTLSGTPTEPFGMNTLTLTANGYSGTTPAVLTDYVYIAPLTPPVWTDELISPNFILGAVYEGGLGSSAGNNSVTATNSPTYSISSGALPNGISLGSSTGALTGTPTLVGNFSFTVRALNSDGNVTKSFSVTVLDSTGKLQVYTSSGWVATDPYVYSGSSWVIAKTYNYNGTAWVQSLAK